MIRDCAGLDEEAEEDDAAELYSAGPGDRGAVPR